MRRIDLRVLVALAPLVPLLGATLPVAAQSGDDLFVKAFNCETDPGGIGMLPVPEGCAEAAGVAFIVATEDGMAVGSCVTADFGGCVVEVPLGTTVVVTEDESTLSPGFAPTENPRVRATPPPPGAAGEFIVEFVNVRQEDTVPATDPAATGVGIASGGIGLTRAAWEAAHGPGEETGLSSPTGAVYAYESGTYFVQFQGGKEEAARVVAYLEVAWEGEGVPYEEAAAAVEALLPADAAHGGHYFAPPTPGGPIALNMVRYTSDALDALPSGPPGSTMSPDLLVIYHERLTEVSTGHQRIHEATVARVTITARTPEGLPSG